MDKPTEGKGSTTIAKKMERNRVLIIDFNNIKLPKDDNVFEDKLYQEYKCYVHIDENNEVMECMLNLPSITFKSSPLSMENIQNHQQQFPALLELQHRNPIQFRNQTISNVPIITIAGTVPNQPTLWKIYLPETLIKSTLKWFHKTLGHCGTDRLFNTILSCFNCNNLYSHCKRYQWPINYQQWKNAGVGYRHHPPQNVLAVPWDKVAVNLIGPWSITVKDVEYVFYALTCIDPVTNLIELIHINNKTAPHVAEQFKNCWLLRYPSPNSCVHDGSGEFTSHHFQQMLINHSITNKQSTTKNPESNGICKRIIMRTSNLTRFEQAAQVMDNALATCMHATQWAVHEDLQTSPEALVFRRDMFVDILIMANFIAIRNRRQQLVDQNLMRHNRKRYDYHYHYLQSYETTGTTSRALSHHWN